MNFTDYLADLTITTANLNTSLAYGYGNSATTEINSLKALIAKAEEMIPILEAEACFNEAEELDREDRLFNNWMVMLYGNGNDSVSPVDAHTINKANRLKRRKQNKKNKSRDRIHGRRHGGAHGGVDFRYVDCNPFCNKHQYVDAMFAINGKHHHNADRKASAMTAREQDFLYNPSISEMEIEQEEKQMEELDTRILDNHYALENVFSNLKEGKYISLFSYWNGEYWEDSSIETNKFCGIKTAEEVKDKVLTEQARRIHLPKIEMETVCEMEGISFQWNSFYDWDDEECGYRKLTFLPLN